jgi:hypothetical protein
MQLFILPGIYFRNTSKKFPLKFEDLYSEIIFDKLNWAKNYRRNQIQFGLNRNSYS